MFFLSIEVESAFPDASGGNCTINSKFHTLTSNSCAIGSFAGGSPSVLVFPDGIMSRLPLGPVGIVVMPRSEVMLDPWNAHEIERGWSPLFTMQETWATWKKVWWFWEE